MLPATFLREIAQILEEDESIVTNAAKDATFVDLGGDSVKATQLAFKLAELGIEVEVSRILDDLSLSELTEECVGTASTVDHRNGDYADKNLTQETSTRPDASSDQYAAFSLVPGDLDAALADAEQQIGCSRSIIEDLLPCTPAQASIWASSLLVPGTYVAQWVWKLRKVDLKGFQWAWGQIFEATPVLRARFVHTADEPYMLAIIKQKPDWKTANGSPESFQHEPTPPMPYGSPLVYFSLLYEADQNVYFRLIMHHSLYDRWSFQQLILNDLQTLFRRNEPRKARPSMYNILKPPTPTFRTAMEDFWRRKLEHNASQSFPKRPSDSLSARTTASVTRNFAIPSKHHNTIAAIVTAAWSLVLSKYHRDNDVGFGVTMWGRDPSVKDALNIASPTFNTVPFQQRLAPEQTVGDFVADVQATLNQCAQYQRMGLTAIAKLSPSAAQACRFGSILVIQPDLKPLNADGQEPILSSTNLVSYRLDQAIGLLLECTTSDGTMKLHAGYDEKILSTDATELLLEHLQDSICQLFRKGSFKLAELEIAKASLPQLSGPTGEVGDYSPPSSDDISVILRLNETLEDCPESTLYEIFATKAKEIPKSPCLLWQGQTISYAEVEKKSNTLAAAILTHVPAGPGCIVTCFEKGVDAVFATLAIMRLGKTFVPIDSTYPVSQKGNICFQTDAQAILTSSSLASHFENDKRSFPLSILCTEILYNEKKINELGPYPSPDSVAYIIFTSGSTGIPKGVVIEHRTIFHTIRDMSALWGWVDSSRVLQFCSYTFDASLLEIFGCFYVGATLCIPSETDKFQRLDMFMKETGVTDAMLTPPAAAMVQPQHQTQLRTLLMGGEALSASHINRWQAAPQLQLSGLYGPTEASAVTVLNKNLSQSAPNVIGKPVACRAFVVDEAMRLLPLGHPGELVLSGPLARGYLKDDAKTNEKFVNVSFAELPVLGQLRIYKTGDIVTMNRDGDISFHGRNDAQIKIGGKRIELGEIEAQLSQTSGLTEGCVAVVIQSTEHSRPELACFFVPREGVSHAARSYLQVLPLKRAYQLVISKLRSAAVKELPKHMVPELFVPVSQIPATVQGKTDRKSLEKVYQDLAECQASVFRWQEDQQRPATSSRVLNVQEYMLRDAWAKVLSRNPESIGLEDTFVSVGGDSIAAIHLSTYLSRSGTQLPVQAIYEHPKLQDMAKTLSHVEKQQAKDEKIAPFELLTGATPVESEAYVIDVAKGFGIERNMIEDAFPTPRYSGFVIDSHILSGDPGLFCGRFGFELFDTVTDENLQRCLRELYKKTPNLRTRIVRKDDKDFNVVLKEERCDLIYFDNLDELRKKEFSRCTGYGEPVSRCSLVRHESKRYFVFTMLHGLYDGWGMRLMFSDLVKAFRDLSALANMPPRPQYSVYARWFQRWPKDAAKAFWRPYLSKIGTSTAIPRVAIDPAKPLQTTVGFNGSFDFDTTASSDLSVTALLHAAMALTCYKIYHETNPAFLTTSLGRRDLTIPGAATMTGPIMTAVPLAVDMQPGRTAEEIAHECQDHLTRAIPYEHFGMVMLAQMRPGLAQWLPIINVTRGNGVTDWHDEFMRYAPEVASRGTTPRTLYFGVVLQENRFQAHVRYDERVVDEATGKDFLDSFLEATRRIFENVHITVEDLLR